MLLDEPGSGEKHDCRELIVFPNVTEWKQKCWHETKEYKIPEFCAYRGAEGV
jgi:hypothetical protein